jgi:hypothetical protein
MADIDAFACSARLPGMAARCTRCQEKAVPSECAFGALVFASDRLIHAAPSGTACFVPDRSAAPPTRGCPPPSDNIPATDIEEAGCRKAARRQPQ